MKYTKAEITTTPDKIDEVCNELYDMGLYSFEIADENEFALILSQAVEGADFVNDKTSVTVYLTSDIDAALSELKKRFETIEISVLDEADYADNWKQYFKPLPLGNNILILPEWEELPAEYTGRVVFKIEPGMSFGTGTHETTQLCIEALEHYLQPHDHILDMGCGSGILFLTGLLLGADSALAVDIDENSARIAANNAGLNDIDNSKYSVLRGDITSDTELQNKIAERKYDVILINIVAEVIIAVLPFVKTIMTDNTILLLSGIINTSTGEVKSELKSLGFKIIEHKQNNDWDLLCVKL